MLFQLQFFFSLKANIDSEFGREFPTAANLLHFSEIFQKKSINNKNWILFEIVIHKDFLNECAMVNQYHHNHISITLHPQYLHKLFYKCVVVHQVHISS